MKVPVSMFPTSPGGISAAVVAVILLGIVLYAAKKPPTPPTFPGYQ